MSVGAGCAHKNAPVPDSAVAFLEGRVRNGEAAVVLLEGRVGDGQAAVVFLTGSVGDGWAAVVFLGGRTGEGWAAVVFLQGSVGDDWGTDPPSVSCNDAVSRMARRVSAPSPSSGPSPWLKLFWRLSSLRLPYKAPLEVKIGCDEHPCDFTCPSRVPDVCGMGHGLSECP